MNLKNKSVIALGAGSSGRSAAALALAAGAEVEVHDACGSITGLPEGVRAVANATAATGESSGCDVLVISPGIDGNGEFAQAYRRHAGEMIGEVELAYRFYGGRVIAITGTNGKTTTTELIDRMLNHSGISSIPCGNYGTPFSELPLMDEPPAVAALEVSSFQLETVVDFHPDVAVWLNFSADHMDRYPTLQAYKDAKLRIFENLDEGDHVVIRAGEDVGALKASVVTFSTEADADFTLRDGWICQNGDRIIDLSVTRLRGLHNAENAMAAFAACSVMGVNAEDASEVLRDFAPPPHRCELIRALDGIEYINDSKATNLHALDSALRSQCRPVILIAGGKQKGLDYTELLPRLKETTRGVVVFGEIAGQLDKTFEPLSDTISISVAQSLEDAVHQARTLAQQGDTILFSPGTSSFDMFSGYEERGDCFRRIVNELK